MGKNKNTSITQKDQAQTDIQIFTTKDMPYIYLNLKKTSFSIIFWEANLPYYQLKATPKDLDNCANYRHISVINNVLKIFAQILDSRLQLVILRKSTQTKKVS